MARARAITLVELLLAVSLISLVILSTGALFTAAAGFFSTFSVQAEMQNQANIALQHIVRHLNKADDVNILEPSRIRVTEVRPDGTTYEYEYWLDGSDIKYNGGGSEEVIASGVSNLVFSDYRRDETSRRVSLAVNLTTQGDERHRLQSLVYVTRVTLRRYE